jgi:hypothetical protein
MPLRSRTDKPNFIGTRGRLLWKRISVHQLDNVFAQLRSELGWINRGVHYAPRIHDLRHTFVVRRILLWRWDTTGWDRGVRILAPRRRGRVTRLTYRSMGAPPPQRATHSSQRHFICANMERIWGPRVPST